MRNVRNLPLFPGPCSTKKNGAPSSPDGVSGNSATGAVFFDLVVLSGSQRHLTFNS